MMNLWIILKCFTREILNKIINHFSKNFRKAVIAKFQKNFFGKNLNQ